MIVSRPKRNTAVALGIFLIMIFGVFFLLLDSLLGSADYFILKLILTPVVLVIGLIVMGKFLASLKTVRFGDAKIEVLFLITRMKTVIPVKEILGWRQEVVNTKNGDFREVKILYDQKKILKLSNRENTEYERVVKYLKQKVKGKKNK